MFRGILDEFLIISKELLNVITKRIESRRVEGICGLVRYLESPNQYDQIFESSLLNYPRKRELAKIARDIYVRLFPNDTIEADKDEDDHEVEIAEEEEPSMKKKQSERAR